MRNEKIEEIGYIKKAAALLLRFYEEKLPLIEGIGKGPSVNRPLKVGKTED